MDNSQNPITDHPDTYGYSKDVANPPFAEDTRARLSTMTADQKIVTFPVKILLYKTVFLAIY